MPGLQPKGAGDGGWGGAEPAGRAGALGGASWGSWASVSKPGTGPREPGRSGDMGGPPWGGGAALVPSFLEQEPLLRSKARTCGPERTWAVGEVAQMSVYLSPCGAAPGRESRCCDLGSRPRPSRSFPERLVQSHTRPPAGPQGSDSSAPRLGDEVPWPSRTSSFS